VFVTADRPLLTATVEHVGERILLVNSCESCHIPILPYRVARRSLRNNC
jgi:hypothetical protein